MTRFRDELVRRKAWIIGIPLLTIWLFVVSNLIWHPIREVAIDPSRVGGDGGQSYVVKLDLARFPFTSYGDRDDAGTRSTARLLENGRPLGPAHTMHQAIREGGKGAFSHFGDGLWFSSSDGTDPRTNGYRYSLVVERELRPRAIWGAFIVTLIGACFFRRLRRLPRRLAHAVRVVIDRPHDAVALSIATLRNFVERPGSSNAAWLAIAAMWVLLAGAWLLFPTSRIELSPSLVQSGYGHAYSAHIDAPFPYALPGDDPVAGDRSTLRLFENGIPLGPAHSFYVAIRDQGKGAFSHYGDRLAFSSSDGTDPRTNGYRYSAIAERQIQGGVICVAVILTGLVLVLTRRFSPITRGVHVSMSLLYGCVRVIGVAGFLLGLLLMASTLLGVIERDQLPTSRLFALVPDAYKVLQVFPIACLIIAALGAIVSWVAALDPLNRATLRRSESVALRHAKAYGWVLVFAVLFSMLGSGGWSGHIGPGENHHYSLAGLVPHSDAGAYYRGSFDMGFGGEWNWVASSRPLGAALRDLITYLGRYSYATSLIVQAALLSIACYAAAISIAYWLGMWSALAFFALALIMIRPFLPTTGSEPLCLIWAFLSVACLAHACRTGAVQPAALALGFLCMAQLTRLGAVLALGAVGLWILALPKYSAAHMARKIALVVIAIGIPAALGSVLNSAYAFQSSMQYLGGVSLGGWNLGALACELGARAGWTECHDLYSQQLQGKSPQGVGDLYSRVWGMISANPHLILQPMADNIRSFLTISPRALVFGYTEYESSAFTVPMILAFAVLPGLIFYFIKIARRPELVLWPALWLAIVVSSSVVLFNDGWRALYATHPLMAAFVAIAFTTPSALRPSDVPMASWKPIALAGVAIALLLVAPWAVHREFSPRQTPVRWQNPFAATVMGGGMITGFLVLPDGQAPHRTLASLSHSDFQTVLKSAKLDERWRASITLFPSPPFAVVWAPRIAKHQFVEIFISPTHVLEDRDVTRWHFDVTPELNNNPILTIVRSAKPLSSLPRQE